MTRDPLRELDAWIHEHVCGKDVVWKHIDVFIPKWGTKELEEPIHGGMSENSTAVAIPRYSRYEDLALEVVEIVIKSFAGEFKLICRATFGPYDKWGAGFGLSPGQEPDQICTANNAPEAICKAVKHFMEMSLREASS